VRKTFLFLGVIAGLIFLFTLIYLPTLSRYRELKAQSDLLDSDIQIIEDKIRALTEEKRLLENDVQYLERIIRDEMGLVKPGEIVYKFVETEPAQEAPAEAVAGNSASQG